MELAKAGFRGRYLPLDLAVTAGLSLSGVWLAGCAHDASQCHHLEPRLFPRAHHTLTLQHGEAPEEVGHVLQQRSRWCKGHMQVTGRSTP
jgi:cellulose synthase/poly-beta-1,6-N-acetylglucosamine synthase-like glycosyltransferase